MHLSDGNPCLGGVGGHWDSYISKFFSTPSYLFFFFLSFSSLAWTVKLNNYKN